MILANLEQNGMWDVMSHAVYLYVFSVNETLEFMNGGHGKDVLIY